MVAIPVSRHSVPASTIGVEGALAAIAGAKVRAQALGIDVSGAVVDRSALPVVSIRMDGASIMAVDLAAAKAWTAAVSGGASDALNDASKPDGGAWGFANALGERLCLLPGGIPIFADGAQIGAIGVSGGQVEDDRSCAEA